MVQLRVRIFVCVCALLCVLCMLCVLSVCACEGMCNGCMVYTKITNKQRSRHSGLEKVPELRSVPFRLHYTAVHYIA